MTDAELDASIIKDEYAKHGRDVNVDALRARLVLSAERSLLRRHEIQLRRRAPSQSWPVRVERPPSSVDVSGPDASSEVWCDAWGYAEIEAWEPAAYLLPVDVLTETWASFDLSVPGGFSFHQAAGDCRANLSTFAFTTWFQLTPCNNAYQSWSWLSIDSRTIGEYRNWDFGFDELHTDIWQLAAANYAYNMFSYDTMHIDSGEFDFLVTGQTDFGAFGSCYWMIE